MSCGVGHRHGSDLALLWLWRRPVAIAPIRLLAQEPTYATGVALTRQKTKKNNNNNLPLGVAIKCEHWDILKIYFQIFIITNFLF